MSRLRLPHLSFARPPVVPVPPTSIQAVRILFGRRAFLQALGAASVLLLAPWTGLKRVFAGGRKRFPTKSERATLDALVDTIIPPDDTPGAAELGVTRYIENLINAFDGGTPRLYAGGPFSNRNPYIDFKRGVPSKRKPRNAFKRFVPPTRLQDLYWRWQIVGTAGLDPDEQALVAPLDAQIGLGPLTGLRDLYRSGLEALDARSVTTEGAPFVDLDTAARERVRDAASASELPDLRRGKNFIGLVVQHTVEGMFSAPEYGGNRKRGGWALTGSAGDSQPLGYLLLSTDDDTYHERPDHPLSTPNPDEIDAPRPLAVISDTLQQFIVAGANGFPDGC